MLPPRDATPLEIRDYRVRELGQRPEGVEVIHDPRSAVCEIWLGRLCVGRYTDIHQIVGAEIVIDWDEVRAAHRAISG